MPQAVHADSFVEQEYTEDGTLEIPPGVNSIRYELHGGPGGSTTYLSPAPGGWAAKVTGTLNTKGVKKLHIKVGMKGADRNYHEWRGGPGGPGFPAGGNGADAGPAEPSFSRTGGAGGGGSSALVTDDETQAVVIAGGGGGAGGWSVFPRQTLPGFGGDAGHMGGNASGCGNAEANQAGGAAGSYADQPGQSGTPAAWKGAGGTGGGGGGGGHVPNPPSQRICFPNNTTYSGAGGGGGGGASLGDHVAVSEKSGNGKVIIRSEHIKTNMVGWFNAFNRSEMSVDVLAASGSKPPLGRVTVSWDDGSVETELTPRGIDVAGAVIRIPGTPSPGREYTLRYEPTETTRFLPSTTVVLSRG